MPDFDMPWLLFVIGLRRIGRFEARDYLREMLGATAGLPTESPGVRDLFVRELTQAASYG